MIFKPHKNTFDETLSSIIGLFLGAALITCGFWARHTHAYQEAVFIETQGTVVDSVSRRERSGESNQEKETYAPVIEFMVNGESVRTTGRYQSRRPINGNTVMLRYDPGRPESSASIVYPFEELAIWGAFGMAGALTVSSLSTLLPVRLSLGGKN